MEQRIERLEELVTYLEETLRVLNDVVVEQANQLDRITKHIHQFSSELRDVRDQLTEKRNPDEERPPHY
ncbi:SlyX family protein [Blastopirellula sp. JC732]|uniref:SlyX family protein n=1 Tax=Blastopirellula sediminis TaxID=2894196 RepID=A0A9X1SGD3_9BACT|nr:SlyX family protein [Blastopirellula sediminis]MCC9606618.1 SlyX family protein [Blastopirellula sediminis]MCC9630085.1 SlyX family protein [Blastopirellula sediminis]